MSADRPTPPRRRSVHFVPGGNDRFFDKALAGEADTLVLDLEDSVPPERKTEARNAVAAWLRDAPSTSHELMVRVNAIDTEWARDDVEAIVAAGAISLMVPKVGAPAELDVIDEWAAGVRGDDRPTLFPVVTETARGVFAIPAVAAHSRVDGVCWGAEDLSAELGATGARDADGRLLDVFVTVRSWCLLGAAAGGVGAVDAVWTDLGDLDGLRREALAGAAMGFDGKITVHPNQIGIVNEAFTPSKAAVEEARELIEEARSHAAEGRLAFSFRGAMVDAPHLARARRLLARARND